jgi:hypothetical protein
MQKILLALLLFPFICQAQGWQWGRGNTGAFMDSWSVATDPFANVFVMGVNFAVKDTRMGYFAIFGSYTVPFSIDSSYGYQAIITKYDANGNFLWAKGTQNGSAYPISMATDREDPNAKWNGTFRGVNQDADVYKYYLKYTCGLNNKSHTLKGDVTLIR